jgi:hypothetical protein
MAKLITICGATGGVGGSVARRMLKEGWSVRAITRNTESTGAKALAELGAQLTTANYDDVTTLEQAFKVRIVFSEYWNSPANFPSGQRCHLWYHEHLRVLARDKPRRRCRTGETTACQYCHCRQQYSFIGTSHLAHPTGGQEAQRHICASL